MKHALGKDAIWVAMGANRWSAAGAPLQSFQSVAMTLGSLGLSPKALSRFYRTRPEGDNLSGMFLNAVMEIEARCPPERILRRLQQIESLYGRQRLTPARDRSLDLDLISCRNLCRQETRLHLPHPRAHERLFVLKPLADLAPFFSFPQKNGKSKAPLPRLLASVQGQEARGNARPLQARALRDAPLFPCFPRKLDVIQRKKHHRKQPLKTLHGSSHRRRLHTQNFQPL